MVYCTELTPTLYGTKVEELPRKGGVCVTAADYLADGRNEHTVKKPCPIKLIRQIITVQVVGGVILSPFQICSSPVISSVKHIFTGLSFMGF